MTKLILLEEELAFQKESFRCLTEMKRVVNIELGLPPDAGKSAIFLRIKKNIANIRRRIKREKARLLRITKNDKY